MTAPIPAPRLSPTAGVFNAIVRHLNRRLRAHIADLNKQLAPVRELNYELHDDANYADSKRSGYVIPFELETP